MPGATGTHPCLRGACPRAKRGATGACPRHQKGRRSLERYELNNGGRLGTGLVGPRPPANGQSKTACLRGHRRRHKEPACTLLQYQEKWERRRQATNAPRAMHAYSVWAVRQPLKAVRHTAESTPHESLLAVEPPAVWQSVFDQGVLARGRGRKCPRLLTLPGSLMKCILCDE